ncbi:MAG TPA: CoA-binding protein [Candidatus Goldiibacteriota bacterium]|nr:CoA-binding protein [Candidatus Goldiibacteriota bacterium]HPI02472.1 CoA-binding protein [Candidatus Goldiibacteriota bacterium]HPN63792.1 CoA-binding protein [Candidatus Goldiibacteriota bacterium]HRQ44093.1 CoA-binding protein [Candidatus Goldiibacteriota bacterium]
MIGKKDVEGFFGNKKIAVIGASRSNKKYGNMLYMELVKKGYEVFPVNPNASEINGEPAFKRVADIPGGVNAAIAVVPAEEQDKVANECAKAGVKELWIHEHVMKGISNTKAIAVCETNGIKCITGFCPMMFMPNAGFPHNIHKGIMGLFGALPK